MARDSIYRRRSKYSFLTSVCALIMLPLIFVSWTESPGTEEDSSSRTDLYGYLKPILINASDNTLNVDSKCHVVIYLEQNTKGQCFVKSTTWTSKDGWTQPVLISSPTRSASNVVSTFNQTSHHLVVAWAASDPQQGITFVDMAQYSVHGDGWGSVYTVSSSSEDTSPETISLSLDQTGTLVVSWAACINNKPLIRAATGEFGGTMFTPITISK